MKRRILSMLLAFALILCAIPMTVMADEPEYAYISISYDGQFLNDKDGVPMAHFPVSLEDVASIDLTEYGLSDYLYDADGDGTYEITALQLIIYIHTVRMGMDWSDVTFTGDPGSSYFAGGLFGFDENLRYDLNGEYPVDEALTEQNDYTVGATSDHIVLSAGDFLDMASFSCWGFYSDDLTGFRYFGDENGDITHAYTTEAGTETQVKLIRTYSSWAGAGIADEAYSTVYYGTKMGTATGTVETDDSGCANITFPSAGTWYVWSDGGHGTDGMGYHDFCDYYANNDEVCFVSSPAYAEVTVESSGPSADEIAAAEVEEKIDAIGTVTLDSEDAIAEAREAYDALTETQKALVENYATLTAAEETYDELVAEVEKAAADEAAATAVEEKIDAIGTVTLDSEDVIAEAREAYDSLTDEQKELVDNYSTLTVAETELASLKDDEAAANTVEDLIDAIGTVTLNSANDIEAAREAYDALTDNQKELVENYDDLVAAEETYQELVAEAEAADEEAATAVEEKIDAIGNVAIFSGSKVNAAADAYNALTEAQKALVENKDVLDSAKEKLADLYEEAADADHRAIYNATGNYIQGLGTPSVGSIGGEWMVIALTRAGNACPDGYYENVVAYVAENINDNEQLHRAKSTDNSRVILGLTSAGYDVTDVGGHNLLFGLTDMNYLKKQGINGPIWALIAFDCYDYEIPTNPDATEQATREGIIEYILSKQHDDGGWSLQANVTLPSDPDMTGMAIQALAPYYDTNSKVKAAVDEALVMLSDIQSDIGGFGSIDGSCTESCVQVIVGLTALGIDPETDPRFIKNGISVLDAMCIFAVDGGGFEHVPNGGRNGMATEQGQYALASYFRFKNDQTSLYDMTDVTMRNETVNEDEGVIKNTTDEDENACEGSLDVADKSLGNAILTDEEKVLVEQGVDVNVSLSVKDVSENVSEEDKTLIDEALEDETLSNTVVGMYLDITLTKQVGDAAPVVITETNDEVKISITVPEDLINTDSNVERTYKILRIHDGKVDVLDAEFDVKTGKLTFKTDAFSTYTLIYSDTIVDTENKDEVVNDTVDKEVIANTNDATNIETPVMGISFGLFGMIAVACLAKKKEF